MRIIAGKFRGKKLLEPSEKVTRPLRDLVRESIFNIIVHSNNFDIKIEKSHVLDLFSGVGSFGLECLSRGALSATFYENYSKTLDILKRNISNLNFDTKTEVIQKDILENNNLNILKKKYEIIFLDPPYKEKRVSLLIESIMNLKLLQKKGIVILHRHKKDLDLYPKKFKILREETYGISKITIGN
tara:strand:- start:51 stop:608 length:558 start_codon:yes stop_codon:yes gene_type:complete